MSNVRGVQWRKHEVAHLSIAMFVATLVVMMGVISPALTGIETFSGREAAPGTNALRSFLYDAAPLVQRFLSQAVVVDMMTPTAPPLAAFKTNHDALVAKRAENQLKLQSLKKGQRKRIVAKPAPPVPTAKVESTGSWDQAVYTLSAQLSVLQDEVQNNHKIAAALLQQGIDASGVISAMNEALAQLANVVSVAQTSAPVDTAVATSDLHQTWNLLASDVLANQQVLTELSRGSSVKYDYDSAIQQGQAAVYKADALGIDVTLAKGELEMLKKQVAVLAETSPEDSMVFIGAVTNAERARQNFLDALAAAHITLH